jgi:hypothetical protein
VSVFAGIDLNSFVVDIVLLDEDTYEARWIRRRIDAGRKADAFDRCRRLRDILPPRTSWADSGVLAIGIEKPMAHNPRGIVPQIRVQGALLACLPTEITIYEFVPATWKSLALGHGHASKADGSVWASKHVRWPVGQQHLPQDAVDAACIAEAARLRHYANAAIDAA